MNMAIYKCFTCGEKIKSADLDKRFVCPSCGSRIFYKPRTKMKTVSSD
ncbi:MAG: DNA-directed RNA polymerase subunit P [archaeon]|nr:DNA-directed RNA polymerase subunit P [archaeon]MCR4324007.1 DNA-directed RNA polymerase subunit P [Nanoarchaeota archaeon]